MDRGRLPAVEELAALVESRANERLPAARLRAAIELSRELHDASDALLERFVGEARVAGLSWTEIGQAFGTSKQAVQKRYTPASGEAGRWPGRWTPLARELLERAGEEARALGHDYVGTEHALLALVSAERGIAGDVLHELGVDRDRMLGTSCMRRGAADHESLKCLSLMPRFKQALDNSMRIADGLADTEHLLAGIVAVSDSMAVEILRCLHVSAADVRAALADRLGVEPQRLSGPRRRRRRLLAGAR